MVPILLLWPFYFRRSPEEGKPNILLISLDTCRPDYLGCYGGECPTPHLDRLAAEGISFTEALCPVPITLPSHCSLMTGTLPPRHGVRDNGPYPLLSPCKTLAELLGQKGYRTAAFVSAAPLRSKSGLSRGFELYDDAFSSTPLSPLQYPERRGEETVRAARRWLEGEHREPFFLWIHLFDPHDPYRPPKPYSQNYAGEIAYTDHCVGLLMESPAVQRNRGKLVVAVVGDHGEGLGEHQEDTHAFFLYDSTLKVPFILWAPRILPERKTIDSQVRLIDLPPTLLQLLQIPFPESFQGVSLVPYIEGKEKKDLLSYGESFYSFLQFRWRQIVSMRTGEYKLILSGKEGELYRLKEDPGEQKNLFYGEEILVKELKERLSAFGEEESKISPSLLDPKQILGLEALGYFSEVSSPQDFSYQGEEKNSVLPCPMKNAKLIRLFQRAVSLCSSKREHEAILILKEIEKKDPGNPAVYFWLGRAFRSSAREEEKRLLEAYGYFSKVLSINPCHLSALNLAIAVLLEMGRVDEADHLIRVNRERGNYNTDTLYLASNMEIMRGDRQAAVAILQEILALDPNHKKARERLGELQQ